MTSQPSGSPVAGNDAPLRVILASQSPRRRELLSLIGVLHTVRPADIDESVHEHEQPVPHAERLARTKAATIARDEPDAVVVGSDTIVVIDDEILGKPRDDAHAAEMLRKLSGRTHTVVTAVAAAHASRVVSAVEQVIVTFRPLSEQAIADYIATREPMDKAGAYGIQGYGATIVERIDGDFFSVMGLPLGKLVQLWSELGFDYRFAPLSRANRSSR